MTTQQIPRETAEVFDSSDYNNKRGLLIQARERREAREQCPCHYDKTELCGVCNYLQNLNAKEISSAIGKLTQIGIGRKTKLIDLLS